MVRTQSNRLLIDRDGHQSHCRIIASNRASSTLGSEALMIRARGHCRVMSQKAAHIVRRQ